MADPNVLPTDSAGSIVSNANLARDENANSNLPPVGQQVLAPTGRIEPAGSGTNGAGQISGTNAETTPTQQNNPTVGTNDTVRPISQTQAINNQTGQLVPAPNIQASVRAIDNAIAATVVPGSTQASVRAIDNAIAATGSPGAGAGADAGGTVPARATSPSPQYQARNQSYVYQAVQVISSFKQGKFEQTLKGILFTQQTANTTQTNAQQRVDPTTIEGYGVNEVGRTKTQQSRPASTSTQASVRAVDNSIIASSQAAVVETFSNVDALGNFTGNYN